MALIVLPAADVVRAATGAREAMKPAATAVSIAKVREAQLLDAETAATFAQRVQGAEAMVALDLQTVRLIERWLPSVKQN